jgi:hypothetical protein
MERGTLIAIYGRKNEGKTATIIQVCRIIQRNFPNAVFAPPFDPLNDTEDIQHVIEIGPFRIGVESQGDPDSRIFAENSITSFATGENRCHVIICATRTKGDTVNFVSDFDQNYGYDIMWLSSHYAPSLNHRVVNDIAANNIVELVQAALLGRLQTLDFTPS